MTEEQIALARRAVACKGWRWMEGMRYQENAVPGMGLWPDGAGRCGRPFVVDHVPEAATPDLTDPATLGCLLALVREAWGDPWAHVAVESGTYTDAPHWYVRAGGFDSYCNSEAESLVVGLEAAP